MTLAEHDQERGSYTTPCGSLQVAAKDQSRGELLCEVRSRRKYSHDSQALQLGNGLGMSSVWVLATLGEDRRDITSAS